MQKQQILLKSHTVTLSEVRTLRQHTENHPFLRELYALGILDVSLEAREPYPLRGVLSQPLPGAKNLEATVVRIDNSRNVIFEARVQQLLQLPEERWAIPRATVKLPGPGSVTCSVTFSRLSGQRVRSSIMNV